MNNYSNDFFAMMQSPFYTSLLSAITILSIILCVGLFIFVAYELIKGVWKFNEGTSSNIWLIIVATLRDTFLITTIYMIIDLLRSIGIYQTTATNLQPDLIGWIRLSSPLLEFFLYVILAAVIYRRLKVIRYWLENNGHKIDKS